MTTGTDNLRWSDTWILAAVHLASQKAPAPLTHLLKASDLINHATPCFEELSSGLARLEHAGWIKRYGKELRFRCTRKASAKFRSIEGKSRTLYGEWKDLEAALGAIEWIPGEPCPHPDDVERYPGLTEEIFTQALDEYVGLHQRRRKR